MNNAGELIPVKNISLHFDSCLCIILLLKFNKIGTLVFR